MILSVVLAAARPWTHWLAVPLLVGSVIYLVAIGIGYYRKVQVPWYLWTRRQEQQRRHQVVQLHPAHESRVLRRPRPDAPDTAAA